MLTCWSPVTPLYVYVCLSSLGWMLHQAGCMCIVSSIPGDLLQAGAVLVIDWFTYILLPNFPAAPGSCCCCCCLADWFCSCSCTTRKHKCSSAHARTHARTPQQSRCQIQVAPLSVCVTFWKRRNARQAFSLFKAAKAVSSCKWAEKKKKEMIGNNYFMAPPVYRAVTAPEIPAWWPLPCNKDTVCGE